MMSAHEDIAAPPQLPIARDIGANLHTVFPTGRDAAAWPLLRQRIEKMLNRYLEPDVRENCINEIEECQLLTYRSISSVIFKYFTSEKKEKIIFIKENNIHKYVDILLQNYPNARFVFQVRDPRDFFASAAERKRWKLRNKFGSTLDALSIWRDDQLGGLRTLKLLGPDRVYFQRYEDLVAMPRPVLEGLCAFLGISFRESMLSFNTRRDVVASATTGGPLENLKRPLMSDNFGKYKDKLSRTKIKIIEAELGDLIQRFGYDRAFPEALSTDRVYHMLPRILAPFEYPFHGWRRAARERLSLSRKTERAAAPLSAPYQQRLTSDRTEPSE